MRRIIASWHGLKHWVCERRAMLRSVDQEIARHRRQRQHGPVTVGQMWHDLLSETTDHYIRQHHRRYEGGTASVQEDSPPWLTPKGVSLALLHQHYIGHRIHHARGEVHAVSQVGPVRVLPMRVVRKRKSA